MGCLRLRVCVGRWVAEEQALFLLLVSPQFIWPMDYYLEAPVQLCYVLNSQSQVTRQCTYPGKDGPRILEGRTTEVARRD
jgi:hypothetical protein